MTNTIKSTPFIPIINFTWAFFSESFTYLCMQPQPCRQDKHLAEIFCTVSRWAAIASEPTEANMFQPNLLTWSVALCFLAGVLQLAIIWHLTRTRLWDNSCLQTRSTDILVTSETTPHCWGQGRFVNETCHLAEYSSPTDRSETITTLKKHTRYSLEVSHGRDCKLPGLILQSWLPLQSQPTNSIWLLSTD